MRDLTAEESRVVAYLRKEWTKKYRVTNIEQAFGALGLTLTPEAQLRIAAFLEHLVAERPSFSRRLRKWGPAAFVLGNNEKLVARCLLPDAARAGGFASIRAIAEAVGLEESDVEAALESLRRLGFARHARRAASPGYRLSRQHPRLLGGLDLSFHAVVLPSGESFNVECAVDALLLGSGVSGSAFVDSSCFHCIDKVRVHMRGGRVLSQRPPGVRLYVGPG